jgi:outer membrane protein assembly factor BamB
LSSDAAGYAYLTYWPSGDGVEWSMMKVDSATGNVAWTTAIAPNGDSSPSTPFVTASGLVQMLGGMPPALLSFGGATGLTTSAALPATSGGLAFPTPDPAIGEDGSLYLVTTPGAGVDGPASVVKIDPVGNTLWASPALPVSPPPATSVTVFALFDVALAPTGVVVVNLGLLLTPYANDTVIVALDPATGQPEWSNVYPGQQDGSLVLGSDGTVITSLFAPGVDGGNTPTVLMLDASGHEKSRTSVPGVQSAWPLAVTTDGTALVATHFEGGTSGMVAISASGDILWNRSGLPFDGTNDGALSSDGVFVSYGTQVFAIDASTGATKWSVDAPQGAGGVCNATVTTGATVVALGCNGVLFGVGD